MGVRIAYFSTVLATYLFIYICNLHSLPTIHHTAHSTHHPERQTSDSTAWHAKEMLRPAESTHIVLYFVLCSGVANMCIIVKQNGTKKKGKKTIWLGMFSWVIAQFVNGAISTQHTQNSLFGLWFRPNLAW